MSDKKKTTDRRLPSPRRPSRLDPERARQMQLRSAESRRKNREEASRLASHLKLILRQNTRDPLTGATLTYAEAISLSLIRKAEEGDVNAFKTIRDTIGEMPVARQEVTGKDGAALPPLTVEIIHSATPAQTDERDADDPRIR